MPEKAFDTLSMLVAYCCDTSIIFCCCPADAIWCHLAMNSCGEAMVIGLKNLVTRTGNSRDLAHAAATAVDVYENSSFGAEANADVIATCNINCTWRFGPMDAGTG